MTQSRAHLIISGRVQGVCFRIETARAARPLNVRGWVRNLPDGSVEALFEGEKADVERAIQWCRKGPPRARVDQVQVHDEPYRGDLKAFDIAY